MCRLLALNPKIKRREAISILENMLGQNTDGVGVCYSDGNKFIINKYPLSLEKVLANKKKNKEFLSHLPNHNGITLIHLRSGNVGSVSKNNTHPWVIGEGKKAFCWMHNGTFSEYTGAKLAMCKSVSFLGETDSEVAGHLVNIAGVRRFTDEIDNAGVFFKLDLDGCLTVIKTSGELSLVRQKGGRMLLASELDFTKYPRQLEALLGYYRFDKNLRYVSHRQKKSQFQWTPAKTAYESSFGGTQKEEKIDPSPTITTWVHDRKTGRMVRKIEKLSNYSNFRQAGLAGMEQGFNHGEMYYD